MSAGVNKTPHEEVQKIINKNIIFYGYKNGWIWFYWNEFGGLCARCQFITFFFSSFRVTLLIILFHIWVHSISWILSYIAFLFQIAAHLNRSWGRRWRLCRRWHRHRWWCCCDCFNDGFVVIYCRIRFTHGCRWHRWRFRGISFCGRCIR